MGVGRTLPVCETTRPSPPSRWAGRYGRKTNGPQARQKKKEDPRRVPPTRKGGSREEEPLPPWCSFPRLSPKKVGLLRGHRRPPGALRPKVASEPPTPRVRTTVLPLVWLAGFEFRSLLTRLKDAGTFCVPWLHGNLSQRVYKRQFHKYHSFFLTILLLFATINMKILSLENVK